MKKEILVLNANAAEARDMVRLLEQAHYRTRTIRKLVRLEDRLREAACMAVIIDIDSVKVDNRSIRNLTLDFPEVCFLCTSRDKFHPELKDAICYHIYACLNKPIDPDELFYWLKCIRENEQETRASP